MPSLTNLSAYKFAPLDDLPALRERLQGAAHACELKGTILLSPEGINLCLAGTRAQLGVFLADLRTVPGLADLQPKESKSDAAPFQRMRVKIKKEIIAFGVDGVDPILHPTPKLAPTTLKRWLDEGRPVTLLDTRNDYEVRIGTFQGALQTGIAHFRDFPTAARQLPAELKQRPVVMFCTGGIRCEKAGPFLEREGFQNLHQLDGGILKYFEECGGAHYHGECFVFDQRVGVDSELRETDSALCAHCQAPVTGEEQRHPHFVAGHSCPSCFERDPAQMGLSEKSAE